MTKSQAPLMKKGYTLIEILIVIVILGLLFGVGYANFRDYARRQAVIAVMRELRADLRLAQEQAIAGKKPNGCSGVLNGVQFNVIGPTSYQILAACSGGNVTIKQVDLPVGITISIPNPNPIVFKSIGQGTNIAATSRVVLGLTQALTNNFRSVIINPTGDIKESTETPDPTASPTPSPSPSPTPSSPPVPSWRYLGSYTLGNGTNINFSTVTASQFSITMTGGGGGDGQIAYHDCWGTGVRFNTSQYGSQEAISGPPWPFPAAMRVGQSAATGGFPLNSVSSLSAKIGSCDGETGGFAIYYYGY